MSSSNNEMPLEDVFYVIPKNITCNDVISSNWHYRDTNTEINRIRDILVKNFRDTGYGIPRPPLMGPHNLDAYEFTTDGYTKIHAFINK